mmetsp:Transcript_19007/g.39701  ORF Transcript_19007/g.39701 Transcript_19007/m.39701 type:complete len:219 (+) Transcript_19007:668-1324(+)
MHLDGATGVGQDVPGVNRQRGHGEDRVPRPVHRKLHDAPKRVVRPPVLRLRHHRAHVRVPGILQQIPHGHLGLGQVDVDVRGLDAPRELRPQRHDLPPRRQLLGRRLLGPGAPLRLLHLRGRLQLEVQAAQRQGRLFLLRSDLPLPLGAVRAHARVAVAARARPVAARPRGPARPRRPPADDGSPRHGRRRRPAAQAKRRPSASTAPPPQKLRPLRHG